MEDLMKRRKYYRRCGYCNRRQEQKYMVSTDIVRGGWLCRECYLSGQPRFDAITDSEDIALRISAEEF